MFRLTLLLAALATAAVMLVRDIQQQLFEPLSLPQAIAVDVPKGASLKSLLQDWRDLGVLDSQRQVWYLSLHARLTGDATRIKAGEYQLNSGMRAIDLTALLVSGRGIEHEMRLIEGWRFDEALSALRENPLLQKTHPPLTPQSIMQALGRSELHPEGRFYPDTYRFPRGTSDLAILRQSFRLMEQVLAQEWEQRATEAVPYASPDEALVMASIVERETSLGAERGAIAGVFVRRLKKNMRLQTDPTVIYGLGAAFDGNLRRRDLLSDTPYNTYTRSGLPPTPICLPGRASIHAALHPVPGDSLYFVAKGDGSHQFSATVTEHNAAVRKYQLRRKKT